MPLLTTRQQAVLDFLGAFQRRHGFMPSTRDIQQHFGYASQTAAISHLQALVRKRAIVRISGMARGWAFPEDIDRAETIAIPVFAGNQKQVGSFTIDLHSLGLIHGTKPFALRVEGDSMEGAHICQGDLVILVKQEPKQDDIVAVLVDGRTELKLYHVEQGQFISKDDDSKNTEVIPVDELEIQGVMVGVYRSV